MRGSILFLVLLFFVIPLHIAQADEEIAGASGGSRVITISVYPAEPTNFQPSDEAKRPALISVKILDRPEESMDGSYVRLRITHIEGKGIIKTGFPHMEGKLLFEGDLPVRNNLASLEYLFSIRGNYLLEAELVRPPQTTALESAEFNVHVKEPSFEIRNAIILLSLLFVFGLYLGRVYGNASQEAPA